MRINETKPISLYFDYPYRKRKSNQYHIMPKTVNQKLMSWNLNQIIDVFLEPCSAILLITWYTYYIIYAKKIINSIWFLRLRRFIFKKHKFKRRLNCPPQKCVRSLLLIILLNKVLQALKRERITWSNGRHERWGGGCCGMRKRRNGWISGWHQCYNSV